MIFWNSEKYKLSSCFSRYFDNVEANESLSKNSIKKYKEVAGKIVDAWGDINVKKIDDSMITRLKKILAEKNLSSQRKNHFLVVLKNLLRYLQEREKLKVYPYEKIRKFKSEQKKIEYLTKEQIKTLLDSIKETGVTRLRLKTAIVCLFSSACRVSELISLNISDINFETGISEIRVKGGKLLRIIFNPMSRKYIKKYLKMRKDGHEALFVTYHSDSPKRWQLNDLERSLRNQGRKVGIKVHPHKLRRSAATFMFQNNVPLPVVQRYLGHSSPSITEKFYLGDSSFDSVIEAHKRVMGLGIEKAEEEGSK